MIVLKVYPSEYFEVFTGTYLECLSFIENLTSDFEDEEKFLVDIDAINLKTKVYTFASKEKGKLFDLVMCEGTVHDVKKC